MRVVQISDTHITHLGGLTTRHLERVISFVNDSIRPDLIVHTGDMVALDADCEDDRRAVQRLHSRFAAPVHFLPGNHDVGDTPLEPWMGMRVTSARIAAFRQAYGGDRWLKVLDRRWGIVGVNSQLLGSGLPEEDEQWRWLDEHSGAVGDRSVLIFMHKPLWAPALKPGAPPQDPAALSVPGDARERILEHFDSGQVEVVATGHLHRSRIKRRGSVLEVWAPTTAFVERSQGVMNEPGQLGVVEYRLSPDGLEHRCWQVPGLPEMVVDEIWDIPELRAELERMGAGAANAASVGDAADAHPASIGSHTAFQGGEQA
jgi:predicted phosphodiesterase